MAALELGHQLLGLGKVQSNDLDSAAAEQLLFALERLVFQQHYARNLVEQDCACAHGARRQGREHGRALVDLGRLAAGIGQGIHLAVQDGVALLYAPVVPSAEHLAVDDEAGADRDAALFQALPSFAQRDFDKLVLAGVEFHERRVTPLARASYQDRVRACVRGRQAHDVGMSPWIWSLVVWNLVVALIYSWDKLMAYMGRRRVSESFLLWLLFLGGCVGAWCAMGLVRHKTRKNSFRWPALVLTVLNPLWLLLWLQWGG